MRVIVIGAGAIGGVIGGLLQRSGHEVELVARGAHLEVLRRQGLRLEVPGQTFQLDLPVAAGVAEVDWSRPAVALLAVKSQHSAGILDELVAAAPEGTPVVCAQNGVDNERQALRRFPATYAMCVMCPASHFQPGVVQAHSWPTAGLLDVGRFPEGVDATAEQLSAALTGAGFESRALPDVMRWKYRKLLLNLGNAVEAVCGLGARGSRLAALVMAEGEAALAAARIEAVSAEEDARRRGAHLKVEATASGPWNGSSSSQSLARRTGSIEADWLNGEISLLGRLHGVATPANDLVRRLARGLALEGAPPGGTDPEELLAQLNGVGR